MPYISDNLILDKDDFPQPPQRFFQSNPYETNHPNFKRWRAAAMARYYRSLYRAKQKARDQEEFLEMVGDARSVLEDPSAWKHYLKERDLDQPKRSPGRPPLNPEDRKKPLTKRSSEMRLLLEDHGIYIDINSYLSNEFSEWLFCPNGRLQRGDESTISVFYFLQQYANT